MLAVSMVPSLSVSLSAGRRVIEAPCWTTRLSSMATGGALTLMLIVAALETPPSLSLTT